MAGSPIPFKARVLRMLRGSRVLLPNVLAEHAPIDLRIVGRTLLHAALVGLAAGLIGAAFFTALEHLSHVVLVRLVGYVPLRAHGEKLITDTVGPSFRPWLLLVVPALGGLGCGLVARFVPEVRGGGADATIDAFHHHGGMVRQRVIWAKALASLFTLGTGGAGGREGPTMQIGAGIGSAVARVLGVSARERRILLLAGVGAGMSAVFRTPLGAAILAVELLYRDGFESDALIPSVLSSVVSYSVVISIFGESTLFTHARRFDFIPAHLPLYAVLAVAIALTALGFVALFRTVQGQFERLRIPAPLKPMLGGLILGALVTPIILWVGARTGTAGQGLGILGGGYGAVQSAISGAPWLPEGWSGVALLLALSATKVCAASITIGSGGSAGDFAPSLAIGGLMGGAFGRAAQLLTHDARIDPGAFALVGMAAFYGGIAHVPLASLVLVCELAGNYDLLVPLMLALGISYAALRRTGIYHAQAATLRDSPAHRDALLLDLLRSRRVAEFMISDRPFVSFEPRTRAAEVIARVAESTWQDVFPVLDDDRRLVGVIAGETVHVLAGQGDSSRWMIVADFMQPPVCLEPDDDLRSATETLVGSGLRELPVVDGTGRVLGFLDEASIAKFHLEAALRAERSSVESRRAEIRTKA
jgi:CIC family chloride channel protein